MNYLFIYFFSILSFILQLNLSSRCIFSPLFSVPIIFSILIFEQKKTIYLSFVLALLADCLSPGTQFTYLLSAIPFSGVLYLFQIWEKKTKPTQIQFPLFAVFPIFFHYVLISFLSFLSGIDFIALFFTSLPLHLIISVILLYAMTMTSKLLNIKEEERSVFQ